MKPIRGLLALLLVFVLAIAAYWWWSPLLVLHRLQAASAQGDADAVNGLVDYPVLRDNLHGQFSAALSKRMDDVKAHPLSALGGMFGLAIESQMIDALVRPETIEAAIRSGQLTPSTVVASAAEPAPGAADAGKLAWTTERMGADRVVARLHRAGEAAADTPAFVLVRHGFADWKLSDIRLNLGG